jgi:hypothetical protein
MHIAQPLHTLSLLTAEHTKSSVVDKLFQKIVTSSGGMQQQQTPGSFETNSENFSIKWCGCEVLSMMHLFPVSFLK